MLKLSGFQRMVLLYGSILAVLAFALHLLRMKHLIYEVSTEVYITIVGAVLLVLGLWLGNRLAPGKKQPIIQVVEKKELNLARVDELGISKREFDVLKLMAEGHSNQQIADTLFISLSTVKTHSSNLYSKLGVTNRTLAIKTAREEGIIA